MRVVGTSSAAPRRSKGTDKHDLTREQRRTWCSEYNIYRITMLYSLVGGGGHHGRACRGRSSWFSSRPLWRSSLRRSSSSLNLYYCLTVIPKSDKAFYPSRAGAWFGWGSLVVFTGLTVVLILARVFNLPLFGA